MTRDLITLPAHWISALVDNDYSGLDEDEAQRVRNRVADLAKDRWFIVDVKRDRAGEPCDTWFTWHYPVYDPGSNCAGGDVLDYVMYRSNNHSDAGSDQRRASP